MDHLRHHVPNAFLDVHHPKYGGNNSEREDNLVDDFLGVARVVT